MTGYGAELKALLAKKKVNQKQAAEVLGVSPAQVSRLIAEKASLNPALAKAIGKNFGPSQKHWLEYLKEDEPEQLSLEDVSVVTEEKPETSQEPGKQPVPDVLEEEPTPAIPKEKTVPKPVKKGKEDKHFEGFLERNVGGEKVSVKTVGDKGMVVIHGSDGPLSKMTMSVFNENGSPVIYRQPFKSKATQGMKKELGAAEDAAREKTEGKHDSVV